MTDGLDAMNAQLKAIESEVLEFSVGVSHVALDEERERYTRIRERIESIIFALEKSKKVESQSELENAYRILTSASTVTETLRYLESISCLENIFTDVTMAATVTAVELSAEDSVSSRVLSSRFLSENVKQCWEYTSQLSNLTAIHLKSAAEFHMFNHEVNEVRAHAKELSNISGQLLEAFSPEGRVGETSNLSNEMTERLNAFENLVERAKFLTSKAPSILPVENRLLEVREGRAKGFEHGGPLMVQLLIDYVGSHFSVKKGDSLPLLDTTENPYLWKVQTHNGPQYIPSIACILASANSEQMHDAYGTLIIVKDEWNKAVENYKKQLAVFYSKYLEAIGHCKFLHVTDTQGGRRLMDDLNRLLVQCRIDDGRLERAMNVVSAKMTSRMENADEVWNHSDISALHKPLLILHDQLQGIKKIDEHASSFTPRMEEYVSAISSEAHGLKSQLESLRMTHDQHRADLKQLFDRVHNWKSSYEESIEGPTQGVGRLVLSSLSSSSGISSEEFLPIPHPPSPIGRITPSVTPEPREVTVYDASDMRRHKPSRLSIQALDDFDEVHVEPSRVFSGGANFQKKQIQTGVNVKQKWIAKPKMVRDVATQRRYRRAIQNTQTDLHGDLVDCRLSNTQSRSSRVDCMTQIGVVKAPKGQQVDGSVISAAMQVGEHRPSIQSISEEVVLNRAEKAYTTSSFGHFPCDVNKRELMTKTGDPHSRAGHQTRSSELEVRKLGTKSPSVESGAFGVCLRTEGAEFETFRKQCDGMTQTQTTMKTSTFERSQPEIESFTMEVPLTTLSGNIETKSNVIKKDGYHHAEIDRASVQLETTPHLPRCYDAEAQLFHAPKVTGSYNGMRNQNDSSLQTDDNGISYEMQTSNMAVQGEFFSTNQEQMKHLSQAFCTSASYSEPKGSERSISDVDLESSGLGLARSTAAIAKGTSYMATHCTCMKMVPRELQTINNASINSFSCALHQPKAPDFIKPLYARCETPRRLQRPASDVLRIAASCQVGTMLVPKEIRVSAVSVEIDDNLVADKLHLPMKSLLCPASVECHPVLTEDAGIQIVDMKEVAQLNIQTRKGRYTAGVVESKHNPRVLTSHMVPNEACVVEFNTSGTETDSGSANLSRTSLNRNTVTQRIFREAEFKITVNGVQSVSLENRGESCSSEPSYATASCQVGVLLLPETLEVGAVPLQLSNMDKSSSNDVAVEAVICPTKVQMKPVLTEDVGINVAKTQGLHHMNVQIGGSMYRASVQPASHQRLYQTSESDGHQLCTLEIKAQESLTENSSENTLSNIQTTSSSKTFSNAAFTIALTGSRSQQETVNQFATCSTCHRQLETSWESSASTEICTSRRRQMTTSQSTQVGVTLIPTKNQFSGVNARTKESNLSLQVGTATNNIIGSSTVKLISTLSETSGIQVKDTGEVDAANSLTEGTTYFGDARSQLAKFTTKPISQTRLANLAQATGDLMPGEKTQIQKPLAVDVGKAAKFRQSECDIEVVNTQVSDVCEFCHGSGRRASGHLSSQNRLASSTSSTYQSVANRNIRGPPMRSIKCQVGTMLRPTRVYLANVEMKPRTTEVAKLIGINANSIICPSSVQLRTELTENAGIEVLDVKDVGSMEVLAGTASFEASVCGGATGKRGERSISNEPSTAKMNIQSGEAGLTIGLAPSQITVPEIVQYTKTFKLQEVGCEFRITNPHIGRVCHTCLGSGRVEGSTAMDSSFRCTSVDYNRKPSFIHQRASTPVSKAVECQVGILLRPSCIQVSNIGINPRNSLIANHLGLKVDSILCPSRVQMQPELTESSGIQVTDLGNLSNIEVQADKYTIDANMQPRQSYKSSASAEQQKKPIQQLNIKNSQNGLTIGQAVPTDMGHGATGTYGTFTLHDIGCEITLRNSTIGTVCTLCHGSGRVMSTTKEPITKIFMNPRAELRHQHSSLVPSPMKSGSIANESKCCQVGAVLTPTCLHVANIEMHPRFQNSIFSSNAVVYPGAVDLESKLTETSGIQIVDVSNVDSINLSLKDTPYLVNVQQTRPANTEVCVLEIKSFSPKEVRRDYSTSRLANGSVALSEKFRLKSVGCEFRLKGVGSSIPNYRHSMVTSVDTRLPVANAPNVLIMQKGKDASSQVGTTLTPTTVQVADLSLSINEQRMMTSLGLKANAILCPSTVELETKLTDTSGITVVDVREVKELGITVGEKKGAVSVAGRKMGVRGLSANFEPPEPAYLVFNSRQSMSLAHTRGMINTTAISETKKTIDRNAGCTFRIRQLAEPLKSVALSRTQLKPEVCKQESIGCQVGAKIIPDTIRVSSVKLHVEDDASADIFGVPVGSTLLPTTCNFKTQLFEMPGIDLVQMNSVDQLELQIENEKFSAQVDGGSCRLKTSTTTGTWNKKLATSSLPGFQRTAAQVTSGAQRADAHLPLTTGPYLIAEWETISPKESLVVLSGLTLGGQKLRLRVNGDIRGKLHVQTGQFTPGDAKQVTGYIGSQMGTANRVLPGRPNSRLCDVACEALIKPDTLEKRLQTANL
uniref:SH3_10 domain-containing protein n=1 Tax=Mesocestoides corti TaxID=53468 RepID=A0A5K3FNB9_MESCO